MTELFFILSHFFLIYLIFSLNVLDNINKFQSLYEYSFAENISVNIIIFLNLILIVSFFNVNLAFIILFFLTYLFFLILINIYKKNNLFLLKKTNFPYIFIFTFISMIIFLELSNDLVIGWDAQKFWIYKTLNFYNGNSIENLKNLPYSYYPYLGSLAWSFFWKISFLDLEYFGRFFYVFIYLSSILLIITNLKVSTFFKLILFFLIVLISYDYTYFIDWSIFSGYQEIIIFSLTTISCHYLFKIFNRKNQNYNIFYILLICNLLIWTKQEGLVISASIITSLLIFLDVNLKKKIFIASLFVIMIFIRFFIFEFYSINVEGIHHGALNFSPNNISELITVERVAIVISFIFFNLITNYLILISVLIIFFQLLKSKNFKLSIFLFLMSFNLICIFFVYILIDPNMDLIEQGIKTTMDRTIFQIAPFTFLILIDYINSFNKMKKII